MMHLVTTVCIMISTHIFTEKKRMFYTTTVGSLIKLKIKITLTAEQIFSNVSGFKDESTRRL